MSSLRLTKKQKKAVAFRERNQKPQPFEQEHDVPEADLPIDFVEQEQLPSESDRGKAEVKHGKNDKSSDLGKRKRDSEQAGSTAADESGKAKKKRRRKHDDVEPEENTETLESESKAKSDDSSKSRFILFVGNLKYTTTVDAVRDHFSKCDPPPQVRLLTPKPKASGSTTTRSKGCAFLEFSHRNSLQQGIKLHGSTLDGRRINVELTAGGGGKSEVRVKKVQTRNKQLLEQRKKRIQTKLDAGEDADTAAIAPPQRHSTTSGMEHVPQKKRTWTVPDQDETSGRGGVKQRGKKTKSLRTWGTGANAITV